MRCRFASTLTRLPLVPLDPAAVVDLTVARHEGPSPSPLPWRTEWSPADGPRSLIKLAIGLIGALAGLLLLSRVAQTQGCSFPPWRLLFFLARNTPMSEHSRSFSTLRVYPVVCALLLAAAPSRADLIPITLDPNGPTIEGEIGGTLSYNAGTGEFLSQTIPTVLGAASLPGMFASFDLSGTTTIDLLVNTDGSFNRNGTGLSISGGSLTFTDGTMVSGTFLTGTITAFGADPPGPATRTFDGLFQVTGGLLTAPIALISGGSLPALFTVGQTAGFFVHAEDVTSGTLGDFTSSFSSDSVKDEEGALVPEPSSLFVALVGTGLVLGWVAARKAVRAACPTKMPSTQDSTVAEKTSEDLETSEV